LTPTYMKIISYIEDLILSGKVLAGEKLPSESDLAKLFSTTRITVRRALDDLEKRGIITRVPSVGTFVREINIVSTKRIGILVNNHHILYGASQFLTSVGARIFTVPREHQTHGGSLSEEKALNTLMSYSINGLIIEPTELTSKCQKLNDLLLSNFPVVFVDREINTVKKVPTVLSDNYEGGRMLGEHFRKVHKSKNSLFVTSEDLQISSVAERYRGICDGVKKQVEVFYVESIDGDFSELVRKIKQDKHDTIFFCNDMLAIRGAFFLLKNDILIPQDVMISGFDNDFVAKMSEPKLTTVRQDLALVGEVAASQLVELLKGEKIESRILLKTELIVRNSCGCK